MPAISTTISGECIPSPEAKSVNCETSQVQLTIANVIMINTSPAIVHGRKQCLPQRCEEAALIVCHLTPHTSLYKEIRLQQ